MYRRVRATVGTVVFQVYDQYRNGFITRKNIEALLVIGDDAKTVAAAFAKRTQMDLDAFEEWVRLNPQATALIEWIYHPPVEHFTKHEIPSFHDALAKETNFSSEEVVLLEKRYWSLFNSRRGVGVNYNTNAKFDAVLMQGVVCSLLPDCVLSRFVHLWDTNNDGSLDFRELLRGLSVACRGDAQQEQLAFYFSVFDTDGDGKLDVAEMRQMAAVLEDIGLSGKTDTLKARERARLSKLKARVRTVSSMEEFDENFDTDGDGDAGAAQQPELLAIEMPAGEAPFALPLSDETERVHQSMLPLATGEGGTFTLDDMPKLFKDVVEFKLLVDRVVQLGYLVFGIRPPTGKAEKSVLQLLKILDDAQASVASDGASKTCYLISTAWWSEWNGYTSSSFKINAKRSKKESRRAAAMTSGGGGGGGGDGIARKPGSRPNSRPGSPRTTAAGPGGGGGGPSPPGEINNQPLIRGAGMVERLSNAVGLGSSSTWGNKLKSKLDRGKNYVVVSEKTWALLHHWYGCDTVLSRPIVSGNKVELFPLTLKIMRQSPPPAKGDAGTGPQGGDQKQKPPPVTFFFRHECSRGQTIKEMIKQLCLAQGMLSNKIKGARPNSVRLWDYRTASSPKLLDDEDATVEDAGFTVDSSQMLMEVRNEDLSWPSELFALSHAKGAKNVETRVGAVDTVKRENGMTGLSNLGNTCYLNAAMQCLSNTEVLSEYFKQNCHVGEINKDNFMGTKGVLARAYANLIRQLWCGKISVAPVKLRAAINAHAPQFTGNDQHDSQELLSFVIDGLHEDLNRVKKKPFVEKKDSDGRPDCVVAKESWDGHLLRNQSVIVDLFSGQIKSELKCKTCAFSSVSFDAFSMLTLPLPTENTAIMDIVVRTLSPGSIPIHYAVEVERDATYHDLKVALVELCAIPMERLVFVEALGTGTQKLAGEKTKPRSRSALMLTCYEIVPQQKAVAAAEDGASEGDRKCAGAPADAEGKVLADAAGVGVAGDGAAATAVTAVVATDNPETAGLAVPAGEPPTPAPPAAAAAAPTAAACSSQPQSRSTSPLPPTPTLGPILPGHLVVLHRRQDQHAVHCLANTVKTAVFGNAFVCATPAGFTAQALYEQVWHRTKRFIRATDAAVPAEYPFTLKVVDAYGSRCSKCRWNRFCHGCLLANEDQPLPEDLVSVAIDWDPTVLHLSYDYSIEHKMETHQSVADLKKKSEEPIQLEDCLKAFTKEEELGLEDVWYCSQCKEHREVSGNTIPHRHLLKFRNKDWG